MTNDCDCDTCKAACRKRPSWFMPGEAEKVAEYLGIPLQELFKTKLGVDWHVGSGDIFLLAPAIQNMSAGQEYPANPRGRCIFFDSELCSIHPVKPFECREYHHSEKEEVCQERHKSVAEAWLDERDQIVVLLGYEPETQGDFGLLDFMGIIGPCTARRATSGGFR